MNTINQQQQQQHGGKTQNKNKKSDKTKMFKEK